MSRDLIERLRKIAEAKAASNRDVGRKGKQWAREAEIEWQAADRIAALEAEASEDARLLGQAGEKIANLSGEIDRLKRDLALAEAEASEGERQRAALIALRGFMPPAGDDRVDEALRLADAALIPAPAREGWQPIETAPKDGTPILAYNTRNTGHHPVVVLWKDWNLDPDIGDEPHWADAATAGSDALYYNGGFFDYWRPLPSPPQDREEQ